jgi:hypothetical protein
MIYRGWWGVKSLSTRMSLWGTAILSQGANLTRTIDYLVNGRIYLTKQRFAVGLADMTVRSKSGYVIAQLDYQRARRVVLAR